MALGGKAANLFVKVRGETKDLEKNLKRAKKKTSAFGNQMKKLGGIIAGAFAVRSIVNFTKRAVEAYDVQAKAEASLLQALKGRRDIQERLIKQAEELQQQTLFGDEETIRAQALAASMGLTYDQIRELIPAAMDLSAAMGQTLDFGVKNLARTYGGLTGELGELMPQLRDLTKEELRAGKAIKLVNEMMGGQAAVAANTGTGPLKQLSNAWGDLTEQIGSSSSALGPFITKLTKVTSLFAQALKLGSLSEAQMQLWGSQDTTAKASGEAAATKQVETLNKKFKEGAITADEYNEKLRAIRETAQANIKLETQKFEDIEKGTPPILLLFGAKSDEKAGIASAYQYWQAFKFKLDELASDPITIDPLESSTFQSLKDLNDELAKYNTLAAEARTIALSREYVAQAKAIEAQIAARKVEMGLHHGTEEPISPMTPIGATQIPVDTDNLDVLLEKMGEVRNEAGNMITDLSNYGTQFGDSFSNMGVMMTDVFSNLGSLFGEVMAGNEDAAKDFGKTMIGVLIKVVAGLAAQAIAAAIAGTAETVPGPWGVALAAAMGAVMAGIVSALVPSFAEGGIVTGPTLAMVGDNPGGREAIIPLGRNMGDMGTQSVRVEVIGKIRGRDIYLANNEYGKSKQKYS